MKKIFVYVILCALISSVAQAALLMEDAITNAASGSNLGSAAQWGNSSAQVKVAAGNLTNATLLSPAVAGNLAYILGTAGGSSYRAFSGSSVTSGAVYYSFLVQCTNAPTTSGYLTGLLPSGTTSPGGSSDALAVYFAPNDNGFQLGIRKSGANITNAPAALATNAVYLVVAKYSFGAGAADDVVSLYLSPTPGAAEPANPDASQTGGTDAANLQNLYFKSSSGYGNWNLDTLRVGTNWADVTPASGAAPPATNSQPVITQTLLLPAGLVLRGTNGTASGVYQVLSSSSIVLPLTNWPAIATNAFDSNGNFNCTNPLSPADPLRFYRLLLGGQLSSTNVAPTITTQPTNQTASVSSNVSFLVAASGTAPLSYQWYFNTNTPLAAATNATLALNNVQTSNAGSYSVIVTNVAGSATSQVATLTVNPLLLAPTLTNQPQSLTVVVSNNATFTVGATGTAPLSYRWYFNTNTPLANATNDSFTITNAQTNNAGGYSVIITNSYGATTSTVATLTVNLSNATPDFSMIGFATLNGFATNGTLLAGGTTGGAGGTHVQVWTAIDLANHLQSNATLIVEIMTNIDLGIPSLASGIAQPSYSNFLAAEILVRSHKTIYSTNGATLYHGTLRIGKPSLGSQQNIIIRNLKFSGLWEYDPSGNYDSKGWDYVHLEEGSHHVWVDHCDFDKVYDGIIDAVHASDYLTVSWCVFRNQKKCSLVGHSNSNQAEDTGHLNVTFHHNYYVDVDERMPRMRFGNAHVFNLYCDNLGGNGIQSTCEAATLVENVYFYHPQPNSLPTREENGTVSSLPNDGKGFLKVTNSTIVNLPGENIQFRQFGQATFVFNAPFVTNAPPYNYTLDPVASVPGIVTNWAGVGKLSY